jgi:glyoxylase-like metal-dependent hydrolase (beta-lactamase superfamily II)
MRMSGENTMFTRRRLLTSAAAVAAAAPLAARLPAEAAAPLATNQAPGWYRYKVGSTEVTVVTDGAFANPLTDTFIRNVKKEETNKALEAMHLQKDKVVVPYTPIVVNTGSRLVVIDTGLGGPLYQQSKGGVGQFHTNLAAAGIDAKAVDAVIISHFHGDHINGLVTADNKPAFPNAEVLVPAPEWTFWNDDGEASKAVGNTLVEGNFKNVKRVFGALGNKVTPYEPGKEIVPGITSLATFGHTPGHVSHIISSGNATVMVQADVTNVPLFVQNPGWFIQFDMDGPAAEATRRKIYDMLAAEKMMVQGFHYPFPSVGYIEKAGSGYRVVPVPWNPSI